MQIECKLVPFC